MRYCRYLFYGVPGSGKTSLIQAIASEHQVCVCTHMCIHTSEYVGIHTYM